MSPYLYVYAITRSGVAAPDGLQTVGGGVLSVLDCGPIAALVSPIDEPEVMAARRHMMAHTKVIEATMAAVTLLPMRFGIIVDGPEPVRAALAPKQEMILQALAGLDGCIEAGIRASWNDAVLYREIVAARPDIGRRAEALGKLNPTAAYYDRIELGREVDSAMAVKRHEERRHLMERLKPIALKHVNLPETDDMSVMNVALLIRREREAEVVAAIEAIDREEGERLQLKIVSPAPVYNFVRMRLEFAPPTEPMRGAA
jgi:Gas vesicle synthesis protein GvpL/GvpF